MAEHNVEVEMPNWELGRKDVVFEVKADGPKLGSLYVSQGAVVWVPANCEYGYKFEWTAFGNMMRDNGTRVASR